MSLVSSRNCGYTLQSQEISVIILPQEGGRIASLKSILSGLECLTQSYRQVALPTPGLETLFRNGACAGIEECLPSVAPCGAETSGGPVPDHGDFWQIPWQVLSAEEDTLTMEADGFSRSLRFRKTLTVQMNTLRTQYMIHNVGASPQSFLYACHPLFAIDPGDRIVLPEDVHTLRLDYSRNNRLGARGDLIDWPAGGAGESLHLIRGVDAGTAEMLYTGNLREGMCGIERMSTKQRVEVHFSAHKLPYLGIWLCYGGWPDDASEHLQYAVALEPTTAPWNSLTEAQTAGDSIMLGPGETYAFEIEFCIVSSQRGGVPSETVAGTEF